MGREIEVSGIGYAYMHGMKVVGSEMTGELMTKHRNNQKINKEKEFFFLKKGLGKKGWGLFFS